MLDDDVAVQNKSKKKTIFTFTLLKNIDLSEANGKKKLKKMEIFMQFLYLILVFIDHKRSVFRDQTGMFNWAVT